MTTLVIPARRASARRVPCPRCRKTLVVSVVGSCARELCGSCGSHFQVSDLLSMEVAR